MRKRNLRVLPALALCLGLALGGCAAPWGNVSSQGGESSPAQGGASTVEVTPEPAPLPAAEGIFPDRATHLVREGDTLRLVTGPVVEEKIHDEDDAEKVLNRFREMLDAADDAVLEFDSYLLAPSGRTCYTFLHRIGANAVENSTVKIIAEEDGTLAAVISSLQNLPVEESPRAITEEEAEAVVRQKLGTRKIYSEWTVSLFMPADVTEEAASTLVPVWLVYTDNRDGDVDRPYLANYVTQSGDYLYSLPVFSPDAPEGYQGFDQEEYFQGMTPDQVQQTVTWKDGAQETFIVPVMVDQAGIAFLCDRERKIYMADYVPYRDNNELSPVNNSQGSFPDRAFGIYANFIKVYDFFKNWGWDGPDGEGNPVLLLYGLCDENGEPQENAYYGGARAKGWQTFVFDAVDDIGRCLDVIAHEFFHCVTHSTMAYSPYTNDQGSINEALSDIIGKLTEQMIRGERLEKWVIGEHDGGMRDMGDPHAHGQPEFVWDLYYVPAVATGTDNNDQGGVHTNSSLLNRIAYRLVEEGMPVDEAQSFWFDVACAVTPTMDYPQISVILQWIVETDGPEYLESLNTVLQETRLQQVQPGNYPPGCGQVVLEVPGAETLEQTDSFFFFSKQEFFTSTPYAGFLWKGTGKVVIMLPEGDYAITAQGTDTFLGIASFSMKLTDQGWVDDGDWATPKVFQVKAGETLVLPNNGLERAAEVFSDTGEAPEGEWTETDGDGTWEDEAA